MTDPSAILLVPTPEYTEVFFRTGPCGARPPLVGRFALAGTAKCPHCQKTLRYSPPPTEQTSDLWCCDSCDQSWYERQIYDFSEHRWETYRGWEPVPMQWDRCALVLAWEGKPLEEGLFRAVRALGKDRGRLERIQAYLNCIEMRGIPDLLETCQYHGLDTSGTLISLDVEGKEVSHG